MALILILMFSSVVGACFGCCLEDVLCLLGQGKMRARNGITAGNEGLLSIPGSFGDGGAYFILVYCNTWLPAPMFPIGRNETREGSGHSKN